MPKELKRLWNDPSATQFATALAGIDDVQTMQNFLLDVMTPNEILEISARLEVARMLRAGKTYVEVIEKTKLSSRTVARISDWLQNGAGGYAAVLDQIKTHHTHTPPARA